MRTQQRYRQIVDRFEAAARAGDGGLDRIAKLCEAVAVNQRTLTRALRAIHGTTPLRHLRALRLAQAREALSSRDAAPESVTEVALQFGFRELGRFAVEYRAAFGESPSETLRRAGTTQPDASRRRAARPGGA